VSGTHYYESSKIVEDVTQRNSFNFFVEFTRKRYLEIWGIVQIELRLLN